MGKTILCSILFFLSSCSTTLNKFFGNEKSVKEHNERLVTEDFQIGSNIFDKFKENSSLGEASEKEKSLHPVIIQPRAEKKVQAKAKALPPRSGIRVLPKKMKKAPVFEKKNPVELVDTSMSREEEKKTKSINYPQSFPEKLIQYDRESKKFWPKFRPTLSVGEEMVLSVDYMGISTGKITIKTHKNTRLGETDVFHISARAKTAKFYSYLYEIDDRCDSYIGRKTFVPLKFSLIQRQSSQNIDDLQLFDNAKFKTYAFYKRVTDKKNTKKKIEKEIPLFFQDPLSILYFIRGLPMKLNEKYSVPIVNKGSIDLLSVEFIKTEEISTGIGRIKAHQLRVYTKSRGETLKGGKMTFWFSADSRRVFLKFKAKIKIGSISGNIDSYQSE